MDVEPPRVEARAVEPGWALRALSSLLPLVAGIAVLCIVYLAWASYDALHSGGALTAPQQALLGASLMVVLGAVAVRMLWRGELRIIAERRHTLDRVAFLLDEERRGQRRYAYRLQPAQRVELHDAAARVRSARDGGRWEELAVAIEHLEERLTRHLAFMRRSALRQYAPSFAFMLLIGLLLRSFVAEAFYIPSGSMIPTLQVGDHIFVNKFIYGLRIPFTDYKIGMGWRTPRRGEVIVFKHPKRPEMDLIKRVVGVAGDTVEMRHNALYLNGEAVERNFRDNGPCGDEDGSVDNVDLANRRQCSAFSETLGSHQFTAIYHSVMGERLVPSFHVPAGHVFVMGDNRDNSDDSRYWGFVPLELVKGKAMIVWYSTGRPDGFRIHRIGQLIE